MVDCIISLEKTCDLNEELLEKYKLSTIDMEFMVGDELFSTSTHDPISSNLYVEMKKGKKTSTSQINELAYTEYLEKIAKQNKPIVHIGFSSGLSGTVFTAQKVAEKINKKFGKTLIYVVDSLCACSGQGLLGIYAREFSACCDKVEDLIDFIENIKLKIKHCYTVDNLKYLVAGGRIKPAVALIGKLLNIKPVMFLDNNGKLALRNKVLLRKRAILALAEECKQSFDKDFKMILISHADCEADAKILSEIVEKQCGVKPIILNLGPIVGSHSGPGTLSIYYVSDAR